MKKKFFHQQKVWLLAGAALLLLPAACTTQSLSTLNVNPTSQQTIQTPQTSQASATPNPNCAVSPQNFEKSLQNLTSGGKTGWLASDGWASTPLPDGKTLMLLGDTFYGTRKNTVFTGGTFKRNMAMIYDPAQPNCWTQLPGGTQEGFFETGQFSEQAWYWPGQPQTQGSLVAVPLAKMVKTSGETGTFNFTSTGTNLQIFDYSDSKLTLASTRKIDFSKVNPPPDVADIINWTNTLKDGDWVYLLGNSRTKSPDALGHNIFVARVPVAKFFEKTDRQLDSVEFLVKAGSAKGQPSGAVWSTDATYETLQPIIENAADATVSSVIKNGKIHVVTRGNMILGTDILDFVSADFTKPFTKTVLMKVPQKENMWSYGLFLHPEWPAPPNKIWATLNFNDAEGSKDNIFKYQPQLFLVPLS